MGAPKLFAAAAGASLAVRGACAAFCSELEAGVWARADDVTSSFPRVNWSDDRAVIAIDDALDAVVAFNFERGIALIDTVEPSKVSRSAAASARRSAV